MEEDSAGDGVKLTWGAPGRHHGRGRPHKRSASRFDTAGRQPQEEEQRCWNHSAPADEKGRKAAWAVAWVALILGVAVVLTP
jgi:hypothetical protein